MALTDNLVSYWQMEEPSGSRYDSVGSNTLTDVNTVTSATGIYGIGGDFEASNSERLTRGAQTWGVSNAWTWSFWYKPESFTGNPRIIFMGPDGGANNIVIGITTGGKLFINLFNSSGTGFKEYANGSSTMSTGSWYHIVATWDGTNLLGYVNNSSQTFTKNVDNAGTMTDSSRGLVIGSTAAGTAPTDGVLDEIAIWSRALSTTEITQLYNGGLAYPYPLDTPLTSGAISYWNMNESSGSRADLISSNTLTDNNTVGSAVGIIGNGADFERSSSESLSIADGSQTGLDFTGGTFSFSTWLKIEDAPTSGQEFGIIDKEITSGSGRQYRFSYQNNGGTPRLLTGVGISGGTNMGFFTANQTLSGASFSHVVWTYSKVSNISKIYVNGSLLSSGTLDATGALDNAAGTFRIGAKFDTPADFFDGIIDEVGAWNREISLAEVVRLYNSGAGLTYPFTGPNGNFLRFM